MDFLTLLNLIRESFLSALEKKKLLHDFGDFAEAYETAEEMAEALSESFLAYIKEEILEDGKVSRRLAEEVIVPMLELLQGELAQNTAALIEGYNEAAGLGIRGILPKTDKNRLEGFALRFQKEEALHEIEWILKEPVAQYARSIVDDTIRENASFHYEAGLSPVITRTLHGEACKWCKELAGTYLYEPGISRHIFRRHANCRCVVEYITKKGRRQDVYTKKWRPETLAISGENGILKLPDIEIAKSVGAKSKNYDILDPASGEYFHFAEGSRIQNAEVFAGKGTKHPLQESVAQGLAEQIGGQKENWQHCKGNAVIDYHSEERPAEVHWFFEKSVGKVKFKIKRWLDEG